MLGQRGLECTVEYGLNDYIVHAELPDGSSLIISPPQEPHPESSESWMVTRHRSVEPAVYEVIYDSEPNGPHARHGGSVPDLLAAVDARLDQLGVPPRQEQERSGKERAANVLPPGSAPSRARVALTPSPSIGQRVPPTGPPTESSARAAPSPARPSSAPRL
ncbi:MULTISPECIES: hypothetical protein [Streptomyces]|nr:hypothetical protein [Streptomyces sp. SID9727]